MKKIITSLLLFTLFIGFSQTSSEIAGIYFKKAEDLYGNFKIQEAADTFEKALTYIDSIQTPKQAHLGFLINYEGKRYEDAKKYAKKYFDISYNKTSEEYQKALMLYVDMQEEIVAIREEEARVREAELAAKMAKEKEMKRIDSLKTSWKNMYETFLVSADEVGEFNKNSLAIFKEKNKVGIIDDTGKKVIPANEYTHGIQNDGYFLFFDKKDNPTKIYCYNTNTKEGYVLPEASEFNRESTNYGKVMMPRGNSRLVAYPNNSLLTMVFDLEAKKFVRIGNLKDLLKSLKKNDKIDKYDDDERTVKVNKEWYSFGNHLGGGVYSLYNTEGKTIHGFLVTNNQSDDPVVVTNIDYVGAFYKSKLQAMKAEDTFWVNDNLGKGETPENENGEYVGDTKIEKQPDGRFKFTNSGMVIFGDKKLEPLADFMRRHSKKK